MADEKPLQVPIKSSFDPKGTDDATKGLNQTKGAASDLKEGAEQAAEAMKGMAEAMGLLLGVAEIVDFLKEATEEFYQNEKAMRAVEYAAEAYGKNTATARKETDEWINSLARLGGVSDNLVAGALGKAYMLTGDLAQAQSRVSLAMDIGTRTGEGFAAGLNILNAALNGQVKQLKDYVPGIKDVGDATKASALAIDYFEKHMRGATIATQDNAKAADQAKVRWEQFKENIGGSVAPVITQFREVLLTIPRTLTLISDLSVVWADSLGRNITAVKNLLENWDNPKAAWKAFQAQRTADELLTDLALKKAYEQNKQEFEKNEAAKTDAATKAAETRVKSNLKAEEQWKKGEYAFAESDWKKFNDDLKRKEKALNLYYKNVSKMRAEDSSDVLRHFGIEETAEEELQKNIQRLIKETLAKKKAAAKTEIEMNAMVGNAVVGIGEEVFGASKEFAIAHAVINTYQGAALALATYPMPYGAIMAALTIAMGIAQIAKIESAEPKATTVGSGFDDPSNDQAAVQGGRRWANDMIGKFSAGVSQGWAEGMRGSSTVNHVDNSRRTTINASIQDPSNIESVKKLIRTIKMVDSNVLGQTSIAARTK